MEKTDNVQRLYEKVAPHILLENTRILAKGVKTLCQDYKRDADRIWSIQELREFVQEAYDDSRIAGGGSSGGYLPQNPYAELFQFREISSPGAMGGKEKDRNDESVRLAAMMQIHHELDLLEGPGKDGLPSADYETICSCLRDIMGFDMCYIAYRYLDETHILAASTVYHRHLHDTLSEKMMADLLDELQRKNDMARSEVNPESAHVRLAGNAYDLPLDNNDGGLMAKGRYILVPLEFPTRPASQGESLYLVFHRSDTKSIGDRELTYRLRDALFLRGRFVKMLDRDFFRLLTISREYRGIDKLSEDSKKLNILHLSDLHVSKTNCERIKQCIRTLELSGEAKIDLIVITGDVAQGRCSAGELEENYSKAAEVIRELAFKMWAEAPCGEDEGKKVLGQDWKKRILIVPGNHDYASMNELETQHDETHRASAGGRPATKEGSSMAKFTYYIDFVRQLLDVDVGRLIDSELNEYRSYSDLGISFLCLNTSIMANPLRNNKVHLDRDFINSIRFKLERDARENKTIVCLCHHGPQYKADYLSDQYYEPYVCSQITRAFGKYARRLLKKIDLQEQSAGDKKALAEARQRLDEAQRELDALWCPKIPGNEGKMLENGVKVQGDELVKAWLDDTEAVMKPDEKQIASYVKKKRKGSRLRTDYDILSAPGDNYRIDERYQNVSSAIRKTLAISDEDTKQCKEAFNSILPFCTVVLSGHIHEANHMQGAPRPGKAQYVANRFFSHGYIKPREGEACCRKIYYLHYGVCTIQEGSDRGRDGRPTVASYDWCVPYFSENDLNSDEGLKYVDKVQEKIETFDE